VLVSLAREEASLVPSLTHMAKMESAHRRKDLPGDSFRFAFSNVLIIQYVDELYYVDRSAIVAIHNLATFYSLCSKSCHWNGTSL
jgi:hypothetical protein